MSLYLNIPGASTPSAVNVVYRNTVVFDWMAATTGTIAVIPATPGYYPIVQLCTGVAVTATGVFTTGLTWSIGNNANEDNLLSSTTHAVAALNQVVTVGPPARVGNLTLAISTVAGKLLSLSTPATVKITTPAAGGTALTGYIQIAYTLVAG